MANLPDAEVILSGLLIALVEKTDYQSKELKGYRATVVTSGGGAAVVNFNLDTPLPFAPLMSEVVWLVQSAPWDMNDNGRNSSGMSTKFLAVIDDAAVMSLGQKLASIRERYPEKASSK